MGYGLGIFLIAVGLILVYAVNFSVSGVDINVIGWILVLAGALVVILTAVQMNSRRRSAAVQTTTHPDGSQSVTESRTEGRNPPPAV